MNGPKVNAERRVRAFVGALTELAIADDVAGIGERHRSNTGAQLILRIRDQGLRRQPRHGDQYEARRIYTAVRFIYRTEPDTN